jgi:hypothetical protein
MWRNVAHVGTEISEETVASITIAKIIREYEQRYQ